MSEYQYYEFLAVDRPLTENQVGELRALSSRATITPVSFTNEYNWGGFKGDPEKLMQRYFDAHVYVANWMTAIFMLRLPIEALPEEMVKAMAVPYTLDIKAVKTHWIITWRLEESENYDRFGVRWENYGRMPKRPAKSDWKRKNTTASNGRSSAARNAKHIWRTCPKIFPRPGRRFENPSSADRAWGMTRPVALFWTSPKPMPFFRPRSNFKKN